MKGGGRGESMQEGYWDENHGKYELLLSFPFIPVLMTRVLVADGDARRS